MSDEVTQAASIIGAGIILRLWSMFEHRKTGKEITEIKLSINGEMERKLEEKYQEGFKDGLAQK